MRKVQLRVRGISPLLMHSFPLVKIEAIEKKSPEDQAEIAAYRDESGALYVPGQAFQRALVSAATYSKGKGRGNLSRVVGGSVLVSPDRLDLGQKAYAIDARAVVVPATKGRVVRYRPRLDAWEFEAELQFDENLLSETQMRRVTDDCGSLVGILDFRPEKRGPFGRFMVVSWKIS